MTIKLEIETDTINAPVYLFIYDLLTDSDNISLSKDILGYLFDQLDDASVFESVHAGRRKEFIDK